MNQGGKFVKIRVGQKYSCEFVKMEFDQAGGFGGKPTVRYHLRDLTDGVVRSMTSSSKKLASQMTKVKAGDQIVIAASLGEGDRKSYDVVVKQASLGLPATPSKPSPDDIPF